ncbi:MAG: peptide chain release factor N(5)-glutamine methyltransferase [Alphaproteobacteria bacterium]|nr:peptide chain release factor N(5)-glutamine methyltransferase [Alphaproteobacteria bacterium]
MAVALESAVVRLSAAGVDNPVFDARLLLCHCAQLDLANIIVDPDMALTDESLQKFNLLIDRRATREPVSHLLGEREFWSMPFIVTSDVLDPRPASETLVEAALDHMKGRSDVKSVLDLGTGSGCLLIAILSELPRARGVGADLSEAALQIARRNSEMNAMNGRATFVTSSWGRDISASFDLILSNPPYISEAEHDDLEPEVTRFEPALALFAGDDGLSAYREIAPDISRLLSSDGVAAIEYGLGQMTSVVEIFAAAGLQHIESRNDLDGIPRCGVFRR